MVPPWDKNLLEKSGIFPLDKNMEQESVNFVKISYCEMVTKLFLP